MLIQFSVKNFKTFKEKATISFVASNYDKETKVEDNIFVDEKFNLRLLKSAVIYGANASGKSKFLEAIIFMRNFVLSSSKDSQAGELIPVDPFRLSTETENEPSEFEIIFTHKNILYRYGFEVNKKNVVSEWLYNKLKTKEIEIFYRERQEIVHHKQISKKISILQEGNIFRNNALIVSVMAQFNEQISINVLEWFTKLRSISGLREDRFQNYTISKVQNQKWKIQILELLQKADIDIVDIIPQLQDINTIPKGTPKASKEISIKTSKEETKSIRIHSDILTSHKKYDDNRKSISSINFSLEKDESSGTKKFFALLGPILDTIENGYTLIIDELDSKLHPNLVSKIISIFNSKELNLKNAQLLFNTHNTNLLKDDLFRRDQIWFTEKNRYGEVILFSLSDFKGIRNNEKFEDNYINGKYGAIPNLQSFDDLKDIIWDKKS